MSLKEFFQPHVKKIITAFVTVVIISILAISIYGAGMIPPVGSFILYPIIAVVLYPPLMFYSFLSKSLSDVFTIPLSWLLGMAYIYILFCLLFYIYDELKKLWKEEPIVKPIVIGITVILVFVIIAKIPGDIARVEKVREKGSAPDAAIQADLSKVRSIAELIFGNEGSYRGLCNESNTLNNAHHLHGQSLKDLDQDIQKRSPNNTFSFCNASKESYCVSAALNSGGYYCVDSTYFSGRTTKPCTSNYRCSD